MTPAPGAAPASRILGRVGTGASSAGLAGMDREAAGGTAVTG